MRKFLFSIVAVFGLFIAVYAQEITADPNELVVDYRCQASQIFGQTTDNAEDFGFSQCSAVCPKRCLYKQPDYTERLTVAMGIPYCIEQYGDYYCYISPEQDVFDSLNTVNFLGIDVDRAPLILVRRVMLGVLAVAGLIIVGFGLVGMYKFAFSEGSQDKVQEAIKIFRSLIVGSIITFAGLALIQIISAATGVTGSLLDFNFLPRTGRIVYLYKDDLGKKCLVEQVADPSSESEHYFCDPDTLVWVETLTPSVTPSVYIPHFTPPTAI